MRSVRRGVVSMAARQVGRGGLDAVGWMGQVGHGGLDGAGWTRWVGRGGAAAINKCANIAS